LLFFSDPASLDDVKVTIGDKEEFHKSNVWYLLNMALERPWLPTDDPTDHDRPVYNYQCYRLRKTGTGAGRIILGKSSNGGQVAVQFSVAEAGDTEAGTLNINDWIRMVGAP
jgi:hypothetical protein